ncbi:FMN-binding protein [Paenibacillus sp. N3/727]|uniref:FMN-binding protein n=1 Tax=Paenibacillus sp. N3/727 TaxID=2925845 RepID=UPI001F52FB2A|nr:FMN-binding protein [Paenibacillus sp. N3/727]UNK19092.1 FMN-binding protein [Paenibacillus sp. N3/727]
MKKKLSIILSGTLVLGGLLAGCGGEKAEEPANTEKPAAEAPATETPTTEAKAGEYTDGAYFAQGEMDEKSGWQYNVTLHVEGGKIKDVNWNGSNIKAGPDKKTLSESGEYGMKEKAGAQAEWHEQAEKAEQFLVEKQDLAAITYNEEGNTDAISGVSIHVNDFVEIAQKAIQAGPTEAGPYKDGGYHAEGEMDANSGWKSTVDLTVANGKVIAAYFSGVNDKGEDKQDFSKDGKYGMKEKGGAQAEWHEQVEKAQQFYLENQGVGSLSFNEEGKTDALSGVSVGVQEYFQLAEKALEGAK